MKIAFDFDHTLDTKRVQETAKKCIARGDEVWIVTARPHDERTSSDNWNDDLYTIATIVGIPKERIKFCDFVPKYKIFENSDFDCHLDDDEFEWTEINKWTDVKCFWFPTEFLDFINFVEDNVTII